MAKKPILDPKTCAHCAFFSPVNPGDEAGYCRRYPPVPIVVDESLAHVCPVVVPEDTCGEFSQRLAS